MPNLQALSNIHNLYLGSDFNAHHRVWLSSQENNQRGGAIINSLHTLSIINNRNQPTRKPPKYNQKFTSPDLTLCSPTLNTRPTWQTLNALLSDHLPVLVTYQLHQPLTTHTKKTYINYKKANWIRFTAEIEMILADFTILNFTSFNHAVQFFNHTILTASNHHIPKGCYKKYSPILTPTTRSLIAQRNRLRQKQIPQN